MTLFLSEYQGFIRCGRCGGFYIPDTLNNEDYKANLRHFQRSIYWLKIVTTRKLTVCPNAWCLQIQPGSRRVTVIVVEHASQAFAMTDIPSCATDLLARFDDMTFETLVVPFAMVMHAVFIDHAPQVVFTKANHTVCRPPCERPIEPLKMRVAVWCARRCFHRPSHRMLK